MIIIRKTITLISIGKQVKRFLSWVLFGVFAFGWSPHQSKAQTLNFENADFTSIQKEKFSIQIPDYLVETDDLDPRALLQLKNIFNETYLMIVPEPKTTALGLHQLRSQFEINLFSKGGKIVARKEIKVTGGDAFQYDVVWQVGDETLAYLITFVDTPTTLYKIYGWTLASQKNYLNDFRKSVASFCTGDFRATR